MSAKAINITIPIILSWDISIYTSKPWPFPNKETPVMGFPAVPLDASVLLLGWWAGQSGRSAVFASASFGSARMGCCPWALALGLPRHKGEMVQHWLLRWVEAGSAFGLATFPTFPGELYHWPLSSTEAISCWSVGHVFFGLYQYWRLWGAQCKSTLWIHRSTSIHDSWWRNEKQSIQLSSCSALVHIQLI